MKLDDTHCRRVAIVIALWNAAMTILYCNQEKYGLTLVHISNCFFFLGAWFILAANHRLNKAKDELITAYRKNLDDMLASFKKMKEML